MNGSALTYQETPEKQNIYQNEGGLALRAYQGLIFRLETNTDIYNRGMYCKENVTSIIILVKNIYFYMHYRREIYVDYSRQR